MSASGAEVVSAVLISTLRNIPVIDRGPSEETLQIQASKVLDRRNGVAVVLRMRGITSQLTRLEKVDLSGWTWGKESRTKTHLTKES